jgi:hypothetical protein
MHATLTAVTDGRIKPGVNILKRWLAFGAPVNCDERAKSNPVRNIAGM